MRIVIDIPKEEIKLYQAYGQINSHRIMSYIANGIVLPEQYGRLIDADLLCEDLIRRWDIADIAKEEMIKAIMAEIVTPIVVGQPTILEAKDGDE